MTDLYNLTGLKESQNLVDLVLVANESTSKGGTYGILILGFLIAVFIIIIMSLMSAKTSPKISDAIMVSSFVCFIFSIFLKSANLIPLILVLAFAAIMAITVFYSFLVKD